MNFHLILICLISEILCISYLSKDTIISLPTNSDTGIIYLKRSEFKPYSNIYIKFRINKGKINTILSYEIIQIQFLVVNFLFLMKQIVLIIKNLMKQLLIILLDLI